MPKLSRRWKVVITILAVAALPVTATLILAGLFFYATYEMTYNVLWGD